MFRPIERKPDFKNLEAVLDKKIPARPTLFEFFLNDRLYARLAGNTSGLSPTEISVKAYDSAGYDYAAVAASGFRIISRPHQKASTISLNDPVIRNRSDFDKFDWQDPKDYSLAEFLKIPEYLPDGMKVIPWGPGGILENVIELLGYENLCMMIYDDPLLVEDVFEQVGKSMIAHYKTVVNYPFVGALISNDDWGFNTQTMLSPADMRKYVFPWHQKIVEIGHRAGKPVILHSCGNYTQIIDDIIYGMKYDARHSYEDNITPIESAYRELKGKIAVLGGLDMNFMVNATPEEIGIRSAALVKEGMHYGGYALGTGNSVPEYIPDENYFAMIREALKEF